MVRILLVALAGLIIFGALAISENSFNKPYSSELHLPTDVSVDTAALKPDTVKLTSPTSQIGIPMINGLVVPKPDTEKGRAYALQSRKWRLFAKNGNQTQCIFV